MKQKIKEKVLKKLEKNFPYTTCAIAINETIDLTLVEVGKVIDKLVPYHYQRMIDDELESMYVYTEEDIKKLKQKLGIK